MLRQLYLKNFVLIEENILDLDSSFIIFSGETGAGKSMLLESLRFLLGCKAQADYIGPHGDSTQVVGIFDLKESLQKILKEEMGIETESGELEIKRELGKNQKSRSYLNGAPTSLEVLKKLGPHLMDIHNQDDQRTLLQPAFHRRMLDIFGSLENSLGAYQEEYQKYMEYCSHLHDLEEKEKNRKDRLELLEFQLKELKSLELKKGEKEILVGKYNQMSHCAEIGESARRWLSTLIEQDGSSQDLLGRCSSEIEKLSAYEPRFREILLVLEEGMAFFSQMGTLLREVAEHSFWDPSDLEVMEKRISELESAEKKYHLEVDALLEYTEKLEEERKTLSQLEIFKEELQGKIQESLQELQKKGGVLSSARKKAAPQLSKLMEKELAVLGMKGCRLEVLVKPLGEGEKGPHGLDHVELWISTNPGIDLKPLHDVGSGGEMSRIMLAIKSILSHRYEIPILFFDEIDGNIGGRLGDVVGERLKRLSKDHQVFCITHLPQIAALGEGHFKIEKKVKKNLTRTIISPLSGEKRVAEIAEMIQGQNVTETAILQAKELLRSTKSPAEKSGS